MAGRVRRSGRPGRSAPGSSNSRMDDIFQSGLHEFISAFIADNNNLGMAISKQYLS